jgi:hypothetical protein
MPPYTRRWLCSQLCALTLALSLVALPLAGVEIQETPILAPLAMELVPLGSTLQSQPGCVLQHPSAVAPPRLILGNARLLMQIFIPTHRNMLQARVPGFSDPRAIHTPKGRSPPSA